MCENILNERSDRYTKRHYLVINHDITFLIAVKSVY